MSSTNTANTVNIIANTNTDDTVNATIYSIISSKPNGITSESLQEILVNSMGIHVKSSVLMESLNNMANEVGSLQCIGVARSTDGLIAYLYLNLSNLLYS